MCLIASIQAEINLPFSQIEENRLYITPNDSLSLLQAQSLSGPSLALYMVHTAQKYNQLFQDSTLVELPLQDRYARTYILHPNNEQDTLYQVDVRIYSPSHVGRRYNRMIIIRPYDEIERPCVLYTHGNAGNMHTWYNYYMIGATSLLQRGFTVAFYENYNNSFFTSDNAKTDPVYQDWTHRNLADSTIELSRDQAIHRGHYLLYQYAYAAHTYLSYIAPDYNISTDKLFTAGHSAGGLSSMQLTFARPERNYQHAIFEYCGSYDSRKYQEISDTRIPIRGVFSSAAGLQDEEVIGSHFGDYLDDQHTDKTVVMTHGLLDPLAPADRGPALWSDFVDTIKMLGPISLHPKLNKFNIPNYSFINCIGEHGVHMYPFTWQDRKGVFSNLDPFAYDQNILTDEIFDMHAPLHQIHLYEQQLNYVMSAVAQIFSAVYHDRKISNSSTLQTIQISDYQLPVDSLKLDWTPIPTDCDVPHASTEKLDLQLEPITNIGETSHNILKVYPNPSQNILHIPSLQPYHHLLMMDISGKTHPVHAINPQTLDISQLQNGTYFLLIRNPNTQQIQQAKFIILK